MDFFRQRSNNCKISLVVCLVLEVVSKIMSFVPILQRRTSSFLSNSGNSEETEEKVDSNTIADLFKPVVESLRILGTFPLVIKTSKNKREEKNLKHLLNRHWRKALCILTGSFCIFLWLAFLWVFALRGSIFGIEIPRNSSCAQRFDAHLQRYREGKEGLISAEMMTWVSHFTLPAGQIMDIILGWLYCSAFVKFLRNFSKIEKSLAGNFGEFWNKSVIEKLRVYRNQLLIIYIVLPTVVFTTLVNWIMTARNVSLLSQLLLSMYLVQCLCIPLLQDTKVVLTYLVFAKMLKQIKLATRAVMAHAHTSEKKMEVDQMKELRKILMMIRDQCEDCCTWQKNRELMIVGNSIFTITLVLYMAANSAGSMDFEENLRNKLFCAGFGFFMVARLYLKVLLAEKITVEERAVAKELMLGATETNDGLLGYEAKVTHDLLVLSPTQMSLGNYVVLDKGLLLKIFYLVVTYMIVLAQFSSSYNSHEGTHG